MMPDDGLRYKFFFGDDLEVQHWLRYQRMGDQYGQIPHTLKRGWNHVKIQVDKDLNEVEIYTNGDRVLLFSNTINNTCEILFEAHSPAVFAIDNVIISTME
jgi:hypothetical protein